MRSVLSFAAAFSCAAFAPLGAQQASSELSPTHWGVVYDVPATKRVTLRPDIPYLRRAAGDLTFDLYAPPGMKRGEPLPAVVFVNAVGDRPGDKVKHWAIYRTWPRLVAAHGMIGISMDADGERIQESLRGIFRFLAEHGAEYGVDGRRLAVYAASANVSGAATYLMGDSVVAGVRAAALYYGGVPEGRLRPDLPVLFVVAQSDVPRMGPALPALWQRVVDSALPWTLLYGRGMPHAFDAFTDTDEARRLLQQTLAFWKSNLEPIPAQPWPRSEGREIVAALYGNDPARAAGLLRDWTARYPEDTEALVQYGRVLADLQRYPEAEAAYTRAYQRDSTNLMVLNGLGRMRLGQQQWAAAEALLTRAIAGGLENSWIHGQVGWARLHLGRNAEAVTSYERAFELGVPPGRSTSGLAWYNLACAYVRVGRHDDALAALGRAAEQGVRERDLYERDDDLAPIRTDPRFQRLLAGLTPASAP